MNLYTTKRRRQIYYISTSKDDVFHNGLFGALAPVLTRFMLVLSKIYFHRRLIRRSRNEGVAVH